MNKSILELKQELVSLQQKGRKFLAIDKLVQYCDIAGCDSSAKEKNEVEDKSYKHQMELWRVEVESGRQGAQFVNESAFNALKTLVLLSGGSSAAVLAFLGSVWSSVAPEVRIGLAAGLAYFGSAVIGAVFAYGLCYISILSFFELEAQKAGNFFRVVAISVVVACYVFMVMGLCECYRAVVL